MRAVRPVATPVRRSPVAALVALALAPQASLAVTYTVTNTGDNSGVDPAPGAGTGTLRQAIVDANANCASDAAPLIQFNIGGTGPFTIAPSTALPILSCSTAPYDPTINGYTQPGASANTLSSGFNAAIQIQLDGTNQQFGCGLQFSDFGYGGGLTVRGLQVANFTYGGFGQGLCGVLNAYGNRVVNNSYGIATGNGAASNIGISADPTARNVVGNNAVYGIEVAYGGTVSIRDNFVGTLDGSTASPNGTGIFVPGSFGSTISGNIVSGNTGSGIALSGDNGSTVSGNFIGTNAAGTAALANAVGLTINNSASFPNNTFVGSNVISGNTSDGISASSMNTVTFDGNKIGTNVGGTAAIPNDTGVLITCSSNLAFGTSIGNTVSGNTSAGVVLSGVDTSTFSGGTIGGAGSLANGTYGIFLDGGTCVPQTGSGNTFTGMTISHNVLDGILLMGGTGNRITQSQIFANGVKNIDINNTSGPLPNDPGDTDGGPNNQQNYPVISSVGNSVGSTSVTWTLDSTVADGFTLEFFANPAAGTPAGTSYVFSTTIPSGSSSGTTTFGGTFNNISMTATDNVTGDTSEFSPMVAVTASPAATISPGAINFGNVAVGTTSASQASTITSIGSASYQINTFDTSSLCYGGAICSGGPFVCTTDCATSPASYTVGQSCHVNAMFAPTVLGPQSTTIFICDNTTASPHTITLSGTGVAAPPLTWAPSSYNFGSVLVGSSGTNQFLLSNPGSSPVIFGSLATTGPFAVSSTNCPSSLAGGASCDATVDFTPILGGPSSGTLCAGATCANLSGTGTFVASIQLPSSIDLGTYTVGTPAVSQTITITNNGNAVVTFSSIAVSAPFTLQNGCPLNLQPGASCTVTVLFSGTQEGAFTGTLTIVSNASGGSRSIPVVVNAVPVPIPVIRVSPLAIGFGDRVVGIAGDSQRVTISNVGTAAATLAALNVTTLDFQLVGTSCGVTLAAASSCFADLAMRPIGFGARRGQLIVGSNAASSPDHVDLGGTGCRPFIASGNRLGVRNNCAP